MFTFDDAYRDNLRYALPVLRRNQCPFTLYVPTALVDGVGEVWWQALEDIIAGQRALAVTDNGETDYLPTATLGEKQATYDLLYGRMRAMPEPERVALIRDLATRYDFDLEAQCRTLIMDWSELRTSPATSSARSARTRCITTSSASCRSARRGWRSTSRSRSSRPSSARRRST